MERYVLMGLLPLALLAGTTGKEMNLKVPMGKAFIYSTVILLLLTLAAACVNYFTKSSPTGRSTDFFFHVQLSNAFLEIHPTYLSLCATASVLLVLFLFVPSVHTFFLTGFLLIMVVLLFARIGLVVLGLVLIAYFVHLLSKGFAVKKLLVICAIVALIITLVAKFSSVYDYEHRSLFVDVKKAWQQSAEPGVNYTDWGIVVRFAIWRASLEVIKENLWLGVGPDREIEMLSEKFAAMGHADLIDEQFNAHNQLLSFLISYGLVGTFFIFLACLLWIRISWQVRNVLHLAVLVLMITYSLTESILNRAYGVCVFSFLNAFLFLGSSLDRGEHSEEYVSQ